jgi:hypothetical protein
VHFRVRENVVRVEQPPALHHLLVCMAGQLGCRSARFSNLVQATSVYLKPLVLDALRARPRSVIVDNLSHGDPRMHRFLQELYYIPDVNLLVTARSGDRIGHVRKLLWDPRERIVVKPLTRSESLRLFEEGCRAFNLRSLDLDDFRRKVVHSAQGNPGQILGMCRLAAESRYRCGRHIKFAPLRIDLLSAFVP